MSYQVDFWLPLKLRKISCCFGLWSPEILGQLVCRVFLFLTCLTCLFLVQGVHCYIALINNEYLLILVTDFALLNYYFQIIKLYKNPVKVHASYLK